MSKDAETVWLIMKKQILKKITFNVFIHNWFTFLTLTPCETIYKTYRKNVLNKSNVKL